MWSLQGCLSRGLYSNGEKNIKGSKVQEFKGKKEVGRRKLQLADELHCNADIKSAATKDKR